jgi:hypothetical protein
MRSLLLGTLFAVSSTLALAASPQCTIEARDKWLSEEAMKAKISALGYTYKVFKVTSGNCYEIYGQDKDGQRIEVYFDPISGDIRTEYKS